MSKQGILPGTKTEADAELIAKGDEYEAKLSERMRLQVEEERLKGEILVLMHDQKVNEVGLSSGGNIKIKASPATETIKLKKGESASDE